MIVDVMSNTRQIFVMRLHDCELLCIVLVLLLKKILFAVFLHRFDGRIVQIESGDVDGGDNQGRTDDFELTEVRR